MTTFNTPSHPAMAQAQQRLVDTARKLTRQAQWLEGQLRQRHEALAERYWLQARRLRDQTLSAGTVAPAAPQVTQAAAVQYATPISLTPLPTPTQQSSVWAELLGAQALKELLHWRFVAPLRQPALAQHYQQRASGGVLMFGPPGTGKTFVARALAQELGVPVVTISPSDIVSKWLGDSEKQLATLFTQARQHPACLMFIDEIDALAAPRDGNGNGNSSGNGAGDSAMARLLTQLLSELDGFAQKPGCIMFLAATNRPWAIDSALLRVGRFDALAYLGLPDASVQAQLLTRTLAGVPTAKGLSWAQAASGLAGMSVAETVACAQRAARIAFSQAVQHGGHPPVGLAHLQAASQGLHRAATPDMLARYTSFAKLHGVAIEERDAGDGKPKPIETTAPNIPTTPTSPSSPGFESSDFDIKAAAYTPLRFVQARELDAQIDAQPFVCYAMQHAGIAPVRSIRLHNSGKEPSQNLVLEVALVPEDFGSAWTCNIAEIAPGATWQVTDISLPLRLERLRSATEKEQAYLRVTVRDKDEILVARTQPMPVLAYNEWVYLPDYLQLSAAFVQPNSPAVLAVVQAAAKRLGAATGDPAFAGYQLGGQERVWQMLDAVHSTLQTDFGLNYINPPPSFELTGQKIRLVADTIAQQRGTCLDLAVLQAAVWEHIGLHPVLVLVPGHAMLACWLSEEAHARCKQAVISGGRNAINNSAIGQALCTGDDLALLNSVEVAQTYDVPLAHLAGCGILDKHLDAGDEVHFIDITNCRASVTPLP